MAVIETHELTKRFGGLLAVDRLNFEIDAGAVTAFLGPNGVGKPNLGIRHLLPTILLHR